VLLTAVVASLSAYVLARFQFRGNQVIYVLYLSGLMIPVNLMVVPLYLIAIRLHLADSLLGLVIIYMTMFLPFSVFVLTSFFRSLPSELADAALVDGCNEFALFWRIMLPLAMPGVITISIFNFLGSWNEYLIALIMILSPEKRTLPLGIYNLVGSAGVRLDWGGLYAGLIVLILPTLLAYILFQRRIESSITLGAFK
jgi:N-acetylglucosamine transport system permease protein